MALDNVYTLAAHALPTPNDTPYQTPSRGLSRHPSHRDPSSPYSQWSPAPFPPGDSYFPEHFNSRNGEHVESDPPLDARRFSREVNATIMARIISLETERTSQQDVIEKQKDVTENQKKVIEKLEESLHQTQTEKSQLSESLNSQSMAARMLRKQMAELEEGTKSAIEEMGAEKDKVVETLADTRKRFEASKKKIRTLEEDFDRAQEISDNDKQNGESEKRTLERKILVLESRVQTVVAELMAVEANARNGSGAGAEMDEGNEERWSSKGNDLAQNRSYSRATSRMSNRSIDDTHDGKEASNGRASRMSILHGVGGSKTGGLSLAEELEGEDNEDDGEHDVDDHGITSPDALPEESRVESYRYSEDQKARRLMGLPSDNNAAGGSLPDQHSTEMTMDHMNPSVKEAAVQYTEAATQVSPPPSPILRPQRADGITEKQTEQTEQAANQRRKRVAIPSVFVEQTLPASTASSKVSTGSQTVDLAPSPSLTPEIAIEALDPAPISRREMTNSSTQTMEDAAPASAPLRLLPPSMDIPVIEIHPPASRPPSSHTSVVLPPRTRNAGCQVALELPRNMKSTPMQTEEIRIDRRPVRVPTRLRPSETSSKPPLRSIDRRKQAANAFPPSIPRRNMRSPPPLEVSPTSPPIPKIENYYPGNNDNGPLNKNVRSGPRRPVRSESIFAGFDDLDDKDADKGNDFSDDEFTRAIPIRKTLSKVKDSWKLVPQSKDSVLDRLGSASETEARDLSDVAEAGVSASKISTAKAFQPKHSERFSVSSGPSRQKDIRRTALVTNGTTAHTLRSRSPSESSAPAAVAPPFPVPTRSSSRRIPVSASEGAVSPSPYTTSFFTARRAQDHSRPPPKRKILRKVQSAAAVTSKSSGQRRPPPMPPMPASSGPPSSPKSLRPIRNQFILPFTGGVDKVGHRIDAIPQRSHAGEASIETPSQQISVVDAMAQTMVGEWMWKYVRKRTSFGVTENPQAEFEMGKIGDNGSSSGARHKRWVWLAPDERAVIWSGKQPTSGPALLGKGGRKLAIQSVLDVKDDTPMPKGSGLQSAFDRSILILTPQRALKFTAVSRERHYIWLTALSFLCHSMQGMDDLASPAPVLPHSEYHRRLPSQEHTQSFRRTPIRDSIRVAKDKSRPTMGRPSSSSPPEEFGRLPIEARMGWDDTDLPAEDAAEPPQVPRIATHTRKRSSTGPRAVPLSALHSYASNPTAMTSSFSLQGPFTREKHPAYPRGGSGPNTANNTMTHRTTESNFAPPPSVRNNFFDAVGTVRMEAFVDRRENQYVESSKGRKDPRSYRTRQGRKKDMSYWGVAESTGQEFGTEYRWKGEDPFRGF